MPGDRKRIPAQIVCFLSGFVLMMARKKGLKDNMDIGIDEIIGVSRYQDPDQEAEGELQVSDLIPEAGPQTSSQDAVSELPTTSLEEAEREKRARFWKIFAICSAVVIAAVGLYALLRFFSEKKRHDA